jgi:hypothetical protein
VSHFETVCVDAIPNETPSWADSAITPYAGAGDDVRGHAREAEREPPLLAPEAAIADASVWLECHGELIDVRLVDVLRIGAATPDIGLIEFLCPRCLTPHASSR